MRKWISTGAMIGLIVGLGGCTPKYQPTPPEALFALRPSEGVAPLTVVCDGSLSFAQDGKIVEYIWDFGDGTRGLGPIVSHTYRRGGTYRVVLEVYSDRGLTSKRESTVTVKFTPPEARFTSAPWRPGAGETVYFDGTASSSPNGVIAEYRWSFGDGQWAVGPRVEHVYRTGGAYPVTLTVVDEAGAHAATTQILEVLGGPGCGG